MQMPLPTIEAFYIILAERRQNKINEMVKTISSVPLSEMKFKVGDKVIFTNRETGVKLEKTFTILGFKKPEEFYGREVYLDWDAYWFPVYKSELELAQ